MEELFKLIIELITNKMPRLSLVDEDCGQLEAGIEEDTYPVTFPCVLIGNLEANWTNVGMGAQMGQVSFSVRLAVDCYDDTVVRLARAAFIDTGSYIVGSCRLIYFDE